MTATLTAPIRMPVPIDAPAGFDAAGFDAAGFARELDDIRSDVLASLGADDADYIRRMIQMQRRLDLAGRATLMAGIFPPAWVAGTAMLGVAKILENMEIGHNVMHGQFDWMRDPEIHSTSWEWDNVCPSSQWKHTHNHMHHQWTNVRGMDRDIGYGILRVDEQQRWHPIHLAQPAIFVLLAAFFEYGVGFHDAESDLQSDEKVTLSRIAPKLRETFTKIRSQVLKDYVAFPALALPLGLSSVAASITGAAAANLMRNLWSFSVIFCGHFPDDVTYFDRDVVENETSGHWYRRQIMGSANFTGGAVMNVMSGNLNHQIEHHLFPDLPANRYVEIAPKVREICARYDVPYNTGSFPRQFGSVIRKIVRLALP